MIALLDLTMSLPKNRPQFLRSFERTSRARVEIIPLIDVMFLLVAFFMVISISMVMQQGIFVDLAPAQSGKTDYEKNDSLVVSIKADGSLYLNKSKLDLIELKNALSKAAAQTTETLIIINADGAASHQSVIAAMDTIRQSGLHNIVFAVEPTDE